MGNSQNVNMAQYIPSSMIQKSAGTWTATLASNVLSDNRTAADAAFNLFVPILVPGNSKPLQGAKLTSVELIYSVGTAAMDSVTTVELEKISVSSAGAVTGAAVTVTLDAGHDTDAERLAVGNHRMVVTLTTPEWVDNDVYYNLYVTFDAAASSVFKLFGAIANFTLRV
jgi:hypothetical protein